MNQNTLLWLPLLLYIILEFSLGPYSVSWSLESSNPSGSSERTEDLKKLDQLRTQSEDSGQSVPDDPFAKEVLKYALTKGFKDLFATPPRKPNLTCTRGEFNGFPIEPFKLDLAGQRISIPAKIRYNLIDNANDSGSVTLRHVIVLDLAEFRKAYLHTLATTTKSLYEPLLSCQFRADINSYGLSVTSPDAFGHIKVDFGAWNCWREELTGAKGENRLGGGNFVAHTTFKTALGPAGLSLVHSVDFAKSIDDVVQRVMEIAGKRIDSSSLTLPNLDLSPINNMIASKLNSINGDAPFPPKLQSAKFVAEDPLVIQKPRSFLFPERDPLPNGFFLKIVQSQSLREKTACSLRQDIADTANPVEQCERSWFSSRCYPPE